MSNATTSSKRTPLRVQVRAGELLRTGQALTWDGALLKAELEDSRKYAARKLAEWKRGAK